MERQGQSDVVGVRDDIKENACRIEERTFFMQLLFLQRQPVLCASAFEAESEGCWVDADEDAGAMGNMGCPPYAAPSAAATAALAPATVVAADADACACAAPDPAPSDAAPVPADSSDILRYLVSNACGFLARTTRWASFLIFSHRGTLQHSMHRHCVPQYSLAPKHWQYSLRHRVRLQVQPMLWTSSRRVEWSWVGDVAASRRTSSRLLARRLLADPDPAAAEEDDDDAAMGLRLTA